ncbi:winged helix-turn-helix transcriptional regulator, partial [Flavobacteriaceae bacterium]|nr:winged helix-turn-helix transcriptional regulator [Flavobacteriaceae bacterium]
MSFSKKDLDVFYLLKASVNKQNQTDISNVSICEKLNFNERTVFRSLKKLEKNNIIKRFTNSIGNFGKKRNIELINELPKELNVSKKKVKYVSKKKEYEDTLLFKKWKYRYNIVLNHIVKNEYKVKELGISNYGWLRKNLNKLKNNKLNSSQMK